MTAPFTGNRPGAQPGLPNLPEPPSGWPVGSYAKYEEAQRAVDHLADNEFPVADVTIVGVDLMLVERVIGRLTWGRVLLTGAASGAWLGLFVGLVLSLLAPVGSGLGLDPHRPRHRHHLRRRVRGDHLRRLPRPAGLHLAEPDRGRALRRPLPAPQRALPGRVRRLTDRVRRRERIVVSAPFTPNRPGAQPGLPNLPEPPDGMAGRLLRQVRGGAARGRPPGRQRLPGRRRHHRRGRPDARRARHRPTDLGPRAAHRRGVGRLARACSSASC